MSPSHRLPGPRKRFGQHFLKDPALRQQLLDVLELKKEDSVVEIGPGRGALTHGLLQRLHHLHAVEIDRDLAALYTDTPYLTLHQQDVLTFDFAALPVPLRVVGNLPYNISTPLLLQLQRYKDRLQDVHIMVQKEVGDRLAAEPGNKAYGRLTVVMQYHFSITALFDIAPEAFHPPPQVHSVFLRMVPIREPAPCSRDFAHMAGLVSTAFQQRRKILRNSLKPLIAEADWEQPELGAIANRRCEDLSVADYVRLSNHLLMIV